MQNNLEEFSKQLAVLLHKAGGDKLNEKDRIRDVVRSNIILQAAENLPLQVLEKLAAKLLEMGSKKEETNTTE